ncbi:MAG: hypothetical protein IJN03_03380 [Bacilli bacterium]|nr:hypothetical protein [Bacilli bacterium]
MDVTAEIPSINLLEKIVMDDIYFFEFSNNKEKEIYGFSVEVLKKHLKEFIMHHLNHPSLNPKFIERAKYYNDKFNMDIPKFRNNNNGLDSELVSVVMQNVEGLNNPLAKARAIYLNLAKVLCYDEHAPAYNQNLDNPTMQDIYFKNTSDITLKNNRVTCNTWALVYTEFLKNIGIDAKVVGNGKHKKVEFEIENTIYTADATNSFLDKDNIYLNDFTRIKLNSPTYGFSGKDKLDDHQIGFNPSSIVEQYEEFSKNHYALSAMRLTTGNPEIDMIVSKLDYLSTLAYHLPQIEAVGYLNQMVRSENKIFTANEINNIMPRQIRLRDSEGLSYTSLVIAIKNNDEFIYKLLHIPEGLITVEKEYFENLLANGEMLDDGNIPGIGEFNR